MADFEESMKLLFQAEFSNRKDKFLHKNKKEDGYTLGGVYEKWNKDSIDWNLVREVVAQNHGDLKKASVVLYSYENVMDRVWGVYKTTYWDKMRLDEVISQKIADEMFLFGVVAHPINAIKLAQRLVGVVDDGIIGKNTLRALNGFDESVFDLKFDDLEVEYFEKVAENKPHLAFNLDGWKNRAEIA